ncbi:MAG: hypothetical protein H7210_10405 [Pyrinomonadaceae bacterium]|nr:hypothetical protein [Phycisphaerales bacterium]
MKSRLQFLAIAATLAASGAAFGIDVTRPGDPVIPSSANFPAGEPPDFAIDNTARTKYLNFDRVGTGFTVTPSGTGIPRHITIITANDAPARDPFSYTLEGSDDGETFTLIASGDLAPTTDRFSISSASFANTTSYQQYRILFTTIRDFNAANSMQVAEVQLATKVDITSPFDTITAVLPKGGLTAPNQGVDKLFDNKLGTKFDVQNAINGPTQVDITPLVGASVVNGLSFFSADDDTAFGGRTPQIVTLLGSNDGSNYTQLFTTATMQATDNFQDQEFDFENSSSFLHYRIILDIPFSSSDMQLGDLQLFGTASLAAPVNDECSQATVITPGQHNGTTTLAGGNDITPCGSGDTIDVWYSYTSEGTGLAEANTCSTPSDTTLAVFEGCGGPLLGCNDDGCFLQSVVQWNAVVGRTYLIRVSMAAGATGPFRLTVNDVAETHTDTPIALNYNFNGMVHLGEDFNPDDPDGFRAISDRGLQINNSLGSLGAGSLVGLTGIQYNVVETAGTLDIVMLGDRNTLDAGNHAFDLKADGDEIGTQPTWLPNSNLTGPQTTTISSNITFGPDTRLGVLYQASNGGTFFNMTLNFANGTSPILFLDTPDWFFDNSPGVAFPGVEAQAQLGIFNGAEDVDNGRTGALLNVVESIVSTESLAAAGFLVDGIQLNSVTFSDMTNLSAGLAIIALSARDAADVCLADFNNDGFSNSQDFFDFLTAFFSQAPNADFNDDGFINSQDFFDFLVAFFQGC